MTTKLTAALSSYPHTAPLTDGTVTVPGYDIDFSTTPSNVVQIFRAMSREMTWDIAEMGITTALCAKEYCLPYTLIPVFVTRRFDHQSISYNVKEISEPRDLEGKKIAMRSPNVPDVLWSLAVLQDTYGVNLKKIEWVVTGEEHVEQAVVDDRCTLAPGENLNTLVETGEVAAIMAGYNGTSPNVKPLIADVKSAERDWFNVEGYIPIHHAVVVKNDVLNKDSSFATAIYEACVQAKQPLLSALARGEDVLATMENPSHAYGFATTAELLMPSDPVPYGIEENSKVLHALISYAYQQGMLTKPYEIEELFDPAWSAR